MMLVVALAYVVFGYRPAGEPNAEWWLTRPLWIVLPFLGTFPLLIGYQKNLSRDSRGISDDATI